jgi:hypothetical protein
MLRLYYLNINSINIPIKQILIVKRLNSTDYIIVVI